MYGMSCPLKRSMHVSRHASIEVGGTYISNEFYNYGYKYNL